MQALQRQQIALPSIAVGSYYDLNKVIKKLLTFKSLYNAYSFDFLYNYNIDNNLLLRYGLTPKNKDKFLSSKNFLLNSQ